MRSATTGTASGCLVWILAAFLIGSCLMPLGYFFSSFTAQSDLAIKTAARFICPKGTTAQVYTYDTTVNDDNGFPVPAVGYELHCVDASGFIVKNDPVLYRFVWEGIGAVLSLLLAILLAFALAAPIGVLVGRLFRRQPAATTG